MVSSITDLSNNNVRSWSFSNFITVLGWHICKVIFLPFLFKAIYIVLSSWMKNFLVAIGSM